MIEDVIVALNDLVENGLIKQYAIGGAVAAERFISAASTEDIDVFVAFAGTPHPLAPLAHILAHLTRKGATLDHEHVIIGGWPVQFLPHDAGPLYESAVTKADSVVIGGLTTRMFDAAHVGAIALQMGRGKDQVRLEEMIRQGVVPTESFHQLVQQYGLEQKWQEFMNVHFPTL